MIKAKATPWPRCRDGLFTRRPSRQPLSKIAGGMLFVIRHCSSGITQMLFFRRQIFFETAFVDRFHERLMRRDYALLQESPDSVVHELHPLSFSGDDHVLQFLRGTFADDGGDGGIGD